jgi:hypothetical protein
VVIDPQHAIAQFAKALADPARALLLSGATTEVRPDLGAVLLFSGADIRQCERQSELGQERAYAAPQAKTIMLRANAGKEFQMSSPRYLYRYRPINQYSLWEIEHNAIHLSRLDNLNDKDEGLFRADTSDLWPVRRYLVQTALQEGSVEYALQCVLISDSDLLQSIDEQMRECLKEPKDWGVVCFTERHDNWHMWERYAQNFRGVALEYDLGAVSIPKDGIQKVKYEERPPLTMVDVFEQQKQGGFFDLLSYKTSDWSKEEEWRVLAPVDTSKQNDADKIFRIPIRRVITGCRASDDEKKLVVEAVHKHGTARLGEYVAPVGQERNAVLHDLQ